MGTYQVKWLISGVLILLWSGCATISTERTQLSSEIATVNEPMLPYDGPKSAVQIIRFGIPEEIVTKYPELGDKRVGWGLYNRLIDGFYDTQRFEFVEEKASIQQRILDNWALTQAGIYVEEEPLDAEGLTAPDYLIYAEVFDFSVSYSEVLVGIAMEKTSSRSGAAR